MVSDAYNSQIVIDGDELYFLRYVSLPDKRKQDARVCSAPSAYTVSACTKNLITTKLALRSMDLRFWRKKRFLSAVVIIIILVASFAFLATLKFDYDRENTAALEYFASQPGMPDAFSALERLTPSDAVVLCWWDYGLAVEKWSHREVIEAYPSREIADSVGSTRSFLGNLKAQLFAKWGSNEKIQDIALAFMLNEEQSLQVLRKYNAKYVLVFVPDELEKFYWIAKVAGYNSTDYLAYNSTSQAYEPATRGQEVTLLRLIYEETWQPRHFTKIFNSEKAKIYRINY